MFSKDSSEYRVSHGTFSVPWLTIAIAMLALILFVLGPDKNSCLLFNKMDICSGEVWRLFTGQLIHNNFDHLFWDLLSFIILGSMIEMGSRKKFVLSYLLSSLSVGAWMFIVEKEYAVYYGLSGLLNGLLVMAVFMKWAEARNRLLLLILPVSIAKILYEIVTKNVFFIDPSIPTIPGTHLAGFLMGLLLVIITERHFLSHAEMRWKRTVSSGQLTKRRGEEYESNVIESFERRAYISDKVAY